MKRWVLFYLLIVPLYGNSDEPSFIDEAAQRVHHFRGVHYFASYYGCDHQKLIYHPALFVEFGRAVKRTGATLLKCYYEGFGTEAMTGMALLSESHATIHTYPEYDSVFVDIFTCGDNCDWRKFESTLAHYLQPKKIRRKVRKRK